MTVGKEKMIEFGRSFNVGLLGLSRWEKRAMVSKIE